MTDPGAGPDGDIGSPRLERALQEHDVEGIGRALRHDLVVVPEIVVAGARQTRVYGSDDDQRPSTLLVFSTVARLGAFLADDPDRLLALIDATRLASFLEQWRARLAGVVFDAGSPHATRASVADVLASLAPRDEDAVAWITGDGPSPAATEDADPVVAIDIRLSAEWNPLDLRDPARGPRVDRRRAPRLADWLDAEPGRLAEEGAGFAAVRLTGRRATASAMSVATFWTELGTASGATGHLDAITARTEGVERFEAAGETVLRRQRIRADAIGGPVLLTDYWRQFPDRRGVARIAFCAPVPDPDANPVARAGMLRLTDSIAAATTWLRRSQDR